MRIIDYVFIIWFVLGFLVSLMCVGKGDYTVDRGPGINLFAAAFHAALIWYILNLLEVL